MEKIILENLLELLYKYSQIPRASVTREKYNNNSEITDYKDRNLRESLIEHVGQLPVVASFLHPYIANKDKVYLPKALAMLAVHDISETELGDIPSTFKKKRTELDEYELSEKMIHPSQLQYFYEYEEATTETALFAKAVDTITSFLNDMLLPPNITQARLDAWSYDIQKVIDIKEKYFEWDDVLYKIFKLLMKEYDLREKGTTKLDLPFLTRKQ